MEERFFDMYVEEMEGIEPLSPQEEEAVLEGAAQGDAGARNRLVEGSLKKVFYLVQDYMGRSLSMSDIIQEANTALMLAAIEYDGGESWEELLSRRVREGVELALKEQETERQVEDVMAARVNVLQTVSQHLAQELGREATLEELSETMKMSQDEIKDIMKLALAALTVSGEGQASSAREGEPNPMKNGWNLDEAQEGRQ